MPTTFMEDGGDRFLRRPGVPMNTISDFCGFSSKLTRCQSLMASVHLSRFPEIMNDVGQR